MGLLNTPIHEDTTTHVVANSLPLHRDRETDTLNTRRWEVCHAEIKHHAKKIGLIRWKYHHRIQMSSKIYIYLRDDQSKNWMSLRIQHIELTSLRSQMTMQEGMGGARGSSGYTWSRWKRHLHGGGIDYPLKDTTVVEARKKALDCLLKMASRVLPDLS